MEVILKLIDLYLLQIRLLVSQVGVLNFWHELWTRKGMILETVLSFNQKNQTGSPNDAKPGDFIINGLISLPYSSNQTIKQLWLEIMRQHYPIVHLIW